MKNKGSSTFDELKRQLKNLEKDIQIKQYDYSSNVTAQQPPLYQN